MKCVVGGVQIDVMIDSGTRRNLISAKTWEYMKRMGVKTREMRKGSNVSFKAYGQNKIITVIGRFEALVEMNGKETYQWFYVVEKGDICLLGEEASVGLGVLCVGADVNTVKSDGFPKIKGSDFMEKF